ncbi:hypothetical protein ACTWQL_19405 [Pseudalkalibacillus sp. R45]|uniref:hypothetical protein n=1 Tax=Pseudalkalibacillus sp. R45 TaxID=3457433 RepID=UPI003FCC6E32
MGNKVEMVKEVQNKVNDLDVAQTRLEEVLEGLEATKVEGQQELAQLHEELAKVEQVKETSTEAQGVRDALKRIQELQSEIELQHGFNGAMDNKTHQVMLEEAESFYKVYNQLKLMYKPMLKATIADASMNSITEDIEQVQAVVSKANSLFSQAKSLLIDSGAIEASKASVRFPEGTSVHMNQRGLDIEELRDLQKVFTDLDRKLFQPVR